MLKSILCLIVLLNVSTCFESDACLRMPCAAGSICVSKGRSEYGCLDEAMLKATLIPLSRSFAKNETGSLNDEDESIDKAVRQIDDSDSEELDLASPVERETREEAEQKKERRQLDLINIPKNFRREYLDFDPCFSSPCLFGKICHKVEGTKTGFLCLSELDASKEITEARNIYRNMELLAKEAILLNVNTISAKNINHGFVTNLKARKMTERKNACSTNPCGENEKCEIRNDKPNGFVCIKVEHSPIKDDNDKIVDLLNDEEFIQAMTEKCRNANENRRFEIENVPSRFVVCLHDAESKDHDFTIMNCPDDLVFNKHLDRCDHDGEPVLAGCDLSPCKFGSTCVDLPNQEYKCECLPGFRGKHCEFAPDVCATEPCGPRGMCHAQPAIAPIAYYCTCFNEKAFGLDCDDERTLEKNPCEDVDSESALFPTKLDGSVFVHCNMHEFSLKYCANGPIIDRHQIDCKLIDLESSKTRKGRTILRSLLTRKRRSLA